MDNKIILLVAVLVATTLIGSVIVQSAQANSFSDTVKKIKNDVKDSQKNLKDQVKKLIKTGGQPRGGDGPHAP